jgi:signal transduction histidine kinase
VGRLLLGRKRRAPAGIYAPQSGRLLMPVTPAEPTIARRPMTVSEHSFPARAPAERRCVVLTAAALLTTLIFAVSEVSSHVAGAVVFLYVIPVTLISLELGIRAGLGGAATTVALIAARMLIRHDRLAAQELLLATATLVGTAAITGRFSNRMHDARRRHRQLLSSGLELAGRAERPGLSTLVARRALELAPARGVRVTIEDQPAAELGRLEGELHEFALRAGVTTIGRITAARPPARPFTRDEHAALELLALQASVVVENERLLELERERAVLTSQLRTAHGLLAEQGRRLELLFRAQETERTELARELHDQTAQGLAAIQLGLRAVERDLSSEPSRAHVQHLRATLAETLQALRGLAVGLRPPVLDELGLEPALRGLAQRASVSSGHRISLELDRIDEIPSVLGTTIYRLVDDLVSALGDRVIGLRIGPNAAGDELRIEAQGSEPAARTPPSPTLLDPIRSRLELSAGALSQYADENLLLVASIPLDAPRQA